MTEPLEKALTLAEHYLEVGRANDALETLERAGSDDTGRVAQLRARAFLELERYPEAAVAAREGLELDPHDPGLLSVLALAEWKLRHHAEAERAILGALELAPDSPDLLCIYAHIVASVGQLDKANRLVERASAIAPDDPEVIRTRAELAYLQGRDAEAELRSLEALSLDPEDSQSHALLGATAAERGSMSTAAGHFSRSASLDPTVSHHAQAARETAVLTHPLMLPLWPIYRFGQGPVWIAGVVLLFGGMRLLPESGQWVLLFGWLGFIAYSWIAPPLLGWWLGRKL